MPWPAAYITDMFEFEFPAHTGVEFRLDQRFDPVPDARTHAGLDRVDPIVEKLGRRQSIGLRG